MIVLSNAATEVIPAGGTVAFDISVLHTGCDDNGRGGSEYHRKNSGAVKLRGKSRQCPSIFDVFFKGNVTSKTAGTDIQLAITIDGTPLAETTMVTTMWAPNSFENMAAMTALKVRPGKDVSLSVTNTGTTPVILDANSALYIRRIA